MEQTYLPLFRKYRPQSFKDIVGQESLVKALSNAIELNRIAQAYLFCGPRGTGKTSTARILAKSLNCERGPTLEPCQKCASCIDITNATGLDVIEIDAASNRGIQDAKELISQVQYAPINGKYKIFIIDEVHMLSNEAFNALLKTFEEPPKNVIFILATTEPHKVLETIVSRCQRFDLRRITVEDIVKRLREIADLEQIKITDSALFTIAKNVSGGLRDSLALLDQVSILGIKDEIDKDLIEELLGKINFDVLLNLLKEIHEANIERTLISIDNIYSKGNEPRNLCENFIEFLRNIVLVLNSKDNQSIISFTNLIETDIETIRACNFDKDRVLGILNTVIEYYKEIKVSTNPYLWMELAGISASQNGKLKIENGKLETNVSNKPSVDTIQNITMNLQAPLQKPVQSNVEVKPASLQPEINQAGQTPPDIKQHNDETQPDNLQPAIEPSAANSSYDPAKLWSEIVSAISFPPTRSFFSGVAKLVGIENNKITLAFLSEDLIAKAKSESRLPLLQNAISQVASGYEVNFIKFDKNIKTIDVKPKIAPSAPAKPNPLEGYIPNDSAVAPPVNVSQNQSQENSADDYEDDEEKKKENKQYSPKVQDMLEQFNGRIIE